MINNFAEKIVTIRTVEENLLSLFTKGKIQGTTHTCIGMEASAVGVISCLNQETDYIISNHRNHGHYIANGGPLKPFFAELLGREGALCNGEGGSQHIHFKNFFSFGILGGNVPIACGIALAEKLNGHPNNIVTIFIGDGAFGEGIVYEALNIASLWELNVFFVVENNKIAQTTDIKTNTAGTLEDRIKAFGIKTNVLKSTDVEEINLLSNTIISEIRNEGMCQALVLENHRLGPHSKGDDSRTVEEINLLKKNDPIFILEQKLGKREFSNLREKIEENVSQVVSEVLSLPHL
jgi:TPP-dependent pyruvate/acetoin dehydrogenase alpha subunit